jgi:hypothetical protein
MVMPYRDIDVIRKEPVQYSRRNVIAALASGLAIPSVIGGVAYWLCTREEPETEPEPTQAKLSKTLLEVDAWCKQKHLAIKDAEKKGNRIRVRELCEASLTALRKELLGTQVQWTGKVDSVEDDGVTFHFDLPKASSKHLSVLPGGKVVLPMERMRRLNKGNSVQVTVYVTRVSMPSIGLFTIYTTKGGEQPKQLSPLNNITER